MTPTTPKPLKRPKQPYPMVEVWWDDASGLRHGWELDLEKIEMQMVLSVGFIVKETDDHLILAQDVDSDGQHNGRSQIPKSMIKRITVLKKGTPTKSA